MKTLAIVTVTLVLAFIAFHTGLAVLDIYDGAFTLYLGPFSFTGSYAPGTWFPGQYL